MLSKMTRLMALVLIFLLCAALFPACEKYDPLADNGFASLEIDEDGEEVTAVVTLNGELLEAQTGSRAFLYELRPGEDISVLSGRDSLDSMKVSASMEFAFPLMDGDYNRIYSAFLLVFNDGSLLSLDGYWIQNPEVLATHHADFAWKHSPKGLSVDHADDATALGVMHAKVEISLSELLSGSLPISFAGQNYVISEAALARLDAEIGGATSAGMQTSLSIKLDTVIALDRMAATLDFLAARYANTAYGLLSAIFFEDTPAASTEQVSSYMRLANQALRSRVENGRVYVVTEQTGLTEAKSFFLQIESLLYTGGPIAWGAAVNLPKQAEKPWETSPESNRLSPDRLLDLSTYLTHSAEITYARWFAVMGISYSAADEKLQAASFAYAYSAADRAGADLIFYEAQTDDAAGIYAENGDTRRIESIFSSIDVGLSATDAALCRETVGEKWDTLDHSSASRLLLSGLPSVGESNSTEELLYDFARGDLQGFGGVGTIAPPIIGAFGTNGSMALGAEIDPSAIHSAGGIRKIFHDATVLEDATSLVIKSFTSGKPYTKTSLTLTLEGVDSRGVRLTYQSTAEVDVDEWSVVDFRITAFLAEADLSQPVVMTLLSDPTVGDEPFRLCVQEIGVTGLESDYSMWATLGIILGCVLVTATLILVIYRLISRRRKFA